MAIRVAKLESTINTLSIEVKGLKKIVSIIWRRLKETLPFLSQTIDTGQLLARTQLLTLLIERFSIEELDDVIFENGINPEAISGDTLNVRARNLIEYVERDGQLSVFVESLRTKRPSVEWPEG